MLNTLEELIDITYNQNQIVEPTMINPIIWSDKKIDFLDTKKRSYILSKLLIPIINIVKKEELYKNAYKNININELEKEESIEDILLKLPVLFKNDTSFGIHGFRSKVKNKPILMKHMDLTATCEIFRSGGTTGTPMPTYITSEDIKLESSALAFRCFSYGNFKSGDRLFNTYNPSHKGGREIQEAAKILNMDVITRRPEDDIDKCIEIIENYNINCIAAVQPPLDNIDKTKKGNGVTFIDLFKKKHELFGEKGIIKSAFVTGYSIPDSIINMAKSVNLNLFTTYGCSEFIPLATSGIEYKKNCNYNTQHILYGPHFTLIVKEENGKIIKVNESETGIVLVTTIGIIPGRTIYLNYALGDVAKLEKNNCNCGKTTPLISSIKRTDSPGDIIGAGCRSV